MNDFPGDSNTSHHSNVKMFMNGKRPGLHSTSRCELPPGCEETATTLGVQLRLPVRRIGKPIGISLLVAFFILAASGWLGSLFQVIGGGVLIVVVFGLAVEMAVWGLVRACNRLNRASRRSLAQAGEGELPMKCSVESQGLRLILDARRQDETWIEQQFASDGRNVEKILRARALRIQAEIDVIRSERGPRTFREDVARN